MVTCPHCRTPQPAAASFCDWCGGTLYADPASPSIPEAAERCATCGTAIRHGSLFCDNCGTALTKGPAAVPNVQPRQCRDCGAQVQPESSFCDLCGAALPTGQEAQQPTVIAMQGAAAPAPRPPQISSAPGLAATVISLQGDPATPQPAPSSPGQLVILATNTTLSLPAGKQELIIGRRDPISGVAPDLDLTDYGGSAAGISRQHAKLSLQHGQVLITDLNSANATFVNQRKAVPGDPIPLNDGDEILLGRMKLRFHC